MCLLRGTFHRYKVSHPVAWPKGRHTKWWNSLHIQYYSSSCVSVYDCHFSCLTYSCVVAADWSHVQEATISAPEHHQAQLSSTYLHPRDHTLSTVWGTLSCCFAIIQHDFFNFHWHAGKLCHENPVCKQTLTPPQESFFYLLYMYFAAYMFVLCYAKCTLKSSN